MHQEEKKSQLEKLREAIIGGAKKAAMLEGMKPEEEEKEDPNRPTEQYLETEANLLDELQKSTGKTPNMAHPDLHKLASKKTVDDDPMMYSNLSTSQVAAENKDNIANTPGFPLHGSESDIPNLQPKSNLAKDIQSKLQGQRGESMKVLPTKAMDESSFEDYLDDEDDEEEKRANERINVKTIAELREEYQAEREIRNYDNYVKHMSPIIDELEAAQKSPNPFKFKNVFAKFKALVMDNWALVENDVDPTVLKQIQDILDIE